MKDSIKIVIAGATGYVGLELVCLLSQHPKVKILHLCAKNSIGKCISLFDSRIKKRSLPKISNIKNVDWSNVDFVFSALPNGEAQKIALTLKNKVKLIDLSADFRIDKPAVYKKWYGLDHKCKKLIKNSVYALTEFKRKKIKKYQIISCPGCYPTSIQLPLIPLIEKKIINIKNIIIDSKSGYSGAGKKIKKKNNYKSILNSVSAYGVGKHRHMPEIDQELTKVAKNNVQVSFTPHLMPMFRGILSTIYVDLVGKNKAKNVHNFLKKYHKHNHFIKIAKFNKPIGTTDVINTNFCNISVLENRKNNKIIIVSAIDNLLKGASGQAVQNMNIICGFKETLGLL